MNEDGLFELYKTIKARSTPDRWEVEKKIEYYRIIEFAIQKHGVQKRKYTEEPCWVHLAQVAGLVSTIYSKPSVIAVAWLHDVLEDTDTTKTEIVSLFGHDVLYGVEFLSDLEGGNRATRKQLSRERLSKAPAWVQDIKVCDLISNTSSILKHDPKFAKIYLEEMKLLLDCLALADKRLIKLAKTTMENSFDNYTIEEEEEEYYGCPCCE
jgi:(p)ppGpp synthase/HD superfamily hydrolase